MRKKKLFLNTGTALLNQIITLICGFILPRQILIHFGSDMNGLVSSITQFLGFISLMEMGVGAVVQSSLYKPLAEKDENEISSIMVAAGSFFNKIAVAMIAYTVILMVFYPTCINNSYGFWSTAILVAAISISSIAQYFFGITNQLLLNADQKSYVQLLVQSIATILNTAVSVLLITAGCSINIVKLGSSLVLLIRPLILHIYVKKFYNIDKNIVLTHEPLKQKWHSMTQHIATFVVDRTDVAVLTVLSTLTNVSIYYVYHLVVTGLYQVFVVMLTGVQALFGDMYARKEYDKFNSTFSFMEWIAHTGVAFLFGCAGVLMIPFVAVYTNGVSDANYIIPVFAWLITLAYAFCCLRGFYNTIIRAVGHYRETQASAIIEAVLNISISIALVWKWGLVGVAIGTLIAMSYRTLYFEIYIKNNILNRSFFIFLKNMLIDALIIVVIYLSTKWIQLSAVSYMGWFIMAIKVCVIAAVDTVIINVIFYRKFIYDTVCKIKK